MANFLLKFDYFISVVGLSRNIQNYLRILKQKTDFLKISTTYK